jgi:hypothetical protein
MSEEWKNTRAEGEMRAAGEKIMAEALRKSQMEAKEKFELHQLYSTWCKLKDFKEELNDTTLGGVNCSNLPQHLWEMIGESIQDIEKIILDDIKKD